MFRLFQSHADPISAETLLRQHGDQLRDAVESHTAFLKNELTALGEGWQQRAGEHFRQACVLSAARRKLGDARLEIKTHGASLTVAAPKEGADGAVLRFQASTLSLIEWHGWLTGDPNGWERMAMITGPVTPDGLRVLARMETVPMEKQSAGFVKASSPASNKRLHEWDELHGHSMLVMAHSHMAKGAASTQPSRTDTDNQLRFAQMGWEAIGCIVSLDGYVRFFDPTRDFAVDVYGKDVELVEEGPRSKVFRLTGISMRPTLKMRPTGVGG